jgi:hypothetical protein
MRDWLQDHTDRSARVMIEERGPTFNAYGNIFPTCPLAYYSQRELVGGLHWANHLLHHFPDFNNFNLLGKKLFEWDEPGLAQALTLYNIGWAVAYSKPAIAFLDSFPALFRPLEVHGDFKFYEVSRTHSYFLEGSGQIQVSSNRFLLSHVQSETGRVVLSYHWHPCLKATPPSRLWKEPLGEDPVGFLGIEDPPEEMEIELDYWTCWPAGFQADNGQ